MVKNWPKVVGNCVWSVGDRDIVEAWNNRWISHDFKIVELGILIPTQLHAARVSDLVKDNGD